MAVHRTLGPVVATQLSQLVDGEREVEQPLAAPGLWWAGEVEQLLAAPGLWWAGNGNAGLRVQAGQQEGKTRVPCGRPGVPSSGHHT